MISFSPAQPYCCIIPKYLLSWAYSIQNELGVLALFLAETCRRIFHHHRQQLALIGTLSGSRRERSVMEWASRTNYPFASGSELIGSARSGSLPATSASLGGGLRRNLFSEAVEQDYWGRPVHWVAKTKLLSYDHWTATNRGPLSTPCYLTPSYLSLLLSVSSCSLINPTKASALSAFSSPLPPSPHCLCPFLCTQVTRGLRRDVICLSFASLYIHPTYFMRDEGNEMKISKIRPVQNFLFVE